MQASRVNCDRDCARLIYLSGLEDRATNKSLERLSVMWYTWVEVSVGGTVPEMWFSIGGLFWLNIRPKSHQGSSS